jgi:hypothetical protein
MIDVNDALRLLRAKRDELLGLLHAVDKALEALEAVDLTVATPLEVNPQRTSENTDGGVLPTRLKPRRVLTDEHKHALKEGRRKARHSKDAAGGLARELSEPSVGLVSTSSADSAPPRLVKRLKH